MQSCSCLDGICDCSWDLSGILPSDDIMELDVDADEDTLYQEQIEYVVRDSARIFRYWRLDSGSNPNDNLNADFIYHMTQGVLNRQIDGVQTVYNSSPYAFENHLEIVQKLFFGGILYDSHLEFLLMQSIQSKWKHTGCPWIYDAPTEYNMAVSQIDWIFNVVGAYAGLKSTGILQSFIPLRYHIFLPSLRILHEIVINIVLHKKQMDCRLLILGMANQELLLPYMERIILALPMRDSTWLFTERDVMKILETLKKH